MKFQLLKPIKSYVRSKLGIPSPLIDKKLGRINFLVQEEIFPDSPDYDTAWLIACVLRAQIFFDIGANIGQSTLLTRLSDRINEIVLVEANPQALIVAAENCIRNHIAEKARFISAFASDMENSDLKLWTIGTGSAGSMYPNHAKSALKANSFIKVSTITVDSLCRKYRLIPDLIKIDVEGSEGKVLIGSRECANHNKTRFLVEMHSNVELKMIDNANNVIGWCDSVGYKAWYLKEAEQLTNPKQIEHRGRCHLMLQPMEWPYPNWLKGISQSDDFNKGLNNK